MDLSGNKAENLSHRISHGKENLDWQTYTCTCGTHMNVLFFGIQDRNSGLDCTNVNQNSWKLSNFKILDHSKCITYNMGESGSSLLIESTNSMIKVIFDFYPCVCSPLSSNL